MTNLEFGSNPEAQMERPQSLDDLTFNRVEEGDPDFDSALRVSHAGDKTEDQLLEAARKETSRLNWWLQEEWQRKGVPKEQYGIVANEIGFDLYNYGQELTPEQILEINRLLAVISQIPLPERVKRGRYIVINNEGKFNDKDGEDMSGYSHFASDMIELFPRAVSSENHRIPDATRLAGTVVHEFGHALQDTDFVQEWKRRFRWNELDKAQPVRGIVKTHETEFPERCVSEYAKFSPEEDICDSFAAAVNNPDALDPEKLAFIQDRWLKDVSPDIQATASKMERVELPKVTSPVKYKVKVNKFQFTSGTVVKRGE
jgi:hypothetical protein